MAPFLYVYQNPPPANVKPFNGNSKNHAATKQRSEATRSLELSWGYVINLLLFTYLLLWLSLIDNK